MMAHFVTGMTIVILALGFEATALQEQNMRDGRFLTRREAPPTYQHYAAEIQLLKNIIAVLESESSSQEAYAQQSNARYQQVLPSTYKGSMQGPSRYDDEMGMQQAAEKFYDRLRAVAAGTRPGSGGGGSFGGGR